MPVQFRVFLIAAAALLAQDAFGAEQSLSEPQPVVMGAAVRSHEMPDQKRATESDSKCRGTWGKLGFADYYSCVLFFDNSRN